MRKSTAIILILTLAVTFAFHTAMGSDEASAPPEKSKPPKPRERLVYEISWAFIKAGKSALTVRDNGDDTIKLVSKTDSYPVLSVFYRVDDRIEVIVEDDEKYLPLSYHLKLREGVHRKERRVTYDREAGTIFLENILDEYSREFEAEGEVHDPISAFYVLRKMPLEVGKSLFIKVFDNGKLYDVEVKALRKERVKVPAGTFDTIVVKPLLKSEGIFIRKGDVYIWVTDDERRLPVKMKSKVAVGSVNAKLIGGIY